MNSAEITRYFELRKRLFEIESQLEALKPAVAEQLRQMNNMARLDGYDLKLSTYTSYDYSPKVADLQQTLNETKRKEREEGVAKIKARRDMLVLKAHRDYGGIREEPETYGEWETDDEADTP
ncbi:MAG: hypothetical protein PHG96_06940 [Kiritimatiellae bacterium]|jgi:hypothetical protein|nr:hypothetical protein [Kiritimatiellia bacterium]MDD3545080.1 hypothetical protein [Kiritimatiellia bacterium]MDD4024909.1 hypothetical protein [Kiritimatiellia bacterium]